MTKVMMCEELATKFTTGAKECLDLSVGANKADTDTACVCWTDSLLAETVEATKVCKFSTETEGGIQSRIQGGTHCVLKISQNHPPPHTL